MKDRLVTGYVYASLLLGHSEIKIIMQDVGCGVGGPARQIARTFGSSVVGLNNNGYQIERARIHTRTAKLNHLCSYIEVCM